MVSARELYDEMIRERVAPALREYGFRRRRNRFTRASGGGWQMIDFQASQFGSRDDVRFTINLHVAYPELEAGGESWTQSRPPPASASHAQERIGMLLPDRLDLWWEVTAGTDAAGLSKETLELIEEVGLAWLEARRDLDRYLDLVRTDAGPQESLEGYELRRMQRLLDRVGRRQEAALVRDELERRGI